VRLRQTDLSHCTSSSTLPAAHELPAPPIAATRPPIT
jgi:hypothetical protein